MQPRAGQAFLLMILAAGLPRDVAAASPDALVFLVSARAAVSELSAADLRRIYLGQLTRWPNHRRIVLAVSPSTTPAGSLFFEQVVRMSEIDFSQHWLGVVFRGEAANSPRVLGSAEASMRFLAQNPDGLAIALRDELVSRDAAVRSIAVDGKRPGDPAYPFRLR